ncbi:hypothetical protein ANCDUO_07763 [Ancylostoma duodenale]|uniref:Uncharacterized protein n=1 Tax=Ancylostoma duodenale TaxID=51022 RepID=A0A0C2GSJ1_9BILA|nr:hypothetical protein ANCDUO_07763 [Ancylostoma duodenale]
MADEDVVVIGDEEKDSDQQDEAMDEYDEVVEEDDQQQPGEQTQEPEDPYANHGGDPRQLDLNRCLLLSCIPSVFLTDPYDVFSNCMLDWISQDFKVSHDAMEKLAIANFESRRGEIPTYIILYGVPAWFESDY